MNDRFGVIFPTSSQNKKGEEERTVKPGTETWRVDSRIGQLLYYMMGVQVKCVSGRTPPCARGLHGRWHGMR